MPLCSALLPPLPPCSPTHIHSRNSTHFPSFPPFFFFTGVPPTPPPLNFRPLNWDNVLHTNTNEAKANGDNNVATVGGAGGAVAAGSALRAARNNKKV